jgi:hypothetical protein
MNNVTEVKIEQLSQFQAKALIASVSLPTYTKTVKEVTTFKDGQANTHFQVKLVMNLPNNVNETSLTFPNINEALSIFNNMEPIK